MLDPEVIKSFNEKEIRIYEYINKNSVKFPYMTIRELAKEIAVSTTTILNFIKKAGYTSYSDFKYAYKIQEKKKVFNKEKYDFKEVIECLGKFDSTFYKDKFKDAISILKDSANVIFIGIGNSGIIAQYGARLFSSNGKFSLAINDPYLRVTGVNNDTTIIALSVSGETSEVIREVKDLKKDDCKVIVITTTENCTLARLSDVTIPYYIEAVCNEHIDITTQMPAIGIIENLSRILQS